MRRNILIISTLVLFIGILAVLSISGCNKINPLAKHKVLVLGIDGMDFHIAMDLMSQGKLPNFSKLAQQGSFKPLLSSIPAQSPVAWSNFITGMNPGGHAIFDFIHRDPETMIPYLSTTKMEGPKKFINLFGYKIPLDSGKIELMRKGDAWWQILERKNIPSVVYRIPSNFPPAEFKGESLAGMGTPDLVGTYGTFSYFTDNPPQNADKFTGGKCYTVWVEGNEVRAELEGPPNTFTNDGEVTKSEFVVYIDPKKDAAIIEINGEQLVLNVGQWSKWVETKFHMAPTVNTYGTVKFFLKQVRPDFKLYASPINIDPLNPALPISTPDDYAAKLAENIGLYYTQGMSQDTKALRYKALNDDEYASQVLNIFDEEKKAFHYEYGRWKEGLLFFYFGTLDLNQHTWWRAMDKTSLMYTEELGAKYGDFIEKLYIQMDAILGEALAGLGPEDTIIVMSDHGFGPYNRQFNVNTWLLENGYIFLEDTASRLTTEFLEGVDWTRTKAYNLGINALYINVRGREKDGIVAPADADAISREIAAKLEAIVDPQTNNKPIRRAYVTKDVYTGPYVNLAPEIIIGYDRGFRGSDDSALGKFPDGILADNLDTWSGDHCVDPEAVPGVLFTNRKATMDLPHLYDLTINVLKEYGIAPSPDMVGKAVW